MQPFFNPTAANGGAALASYVVPNCLRLFVLSVFNVSAGARYVHLYDATAVPANGVTPLLVWPLSAGTALLPQVTFQDVGRLFTNGICVVSSTTASTLTLGGADFLVDVVAS